jgi:hypothetical protein
MVQQRAECSDRRPFRTRPLATRPVTNPNSPYPLKGTILDEGDNTRGNGSVKPKVHNNACRNVCMVGKIYCLELLAEDASDLNE